MLRVFVLIVTLVIAVGGFKYARDPYRTALPTEVADLSPIAPQLARLPPADRELVVAYLKRSNGDVLPPNLADPDSPFTARNFREAIQLQEKFLQKQAQEMARLKAREAEREKQMAPLREAVSIRLVRREILSREELASRPLFSTLADGRISKRALDTRNIQVTTWRLDNISGYTGIQSLQAKVWVRKVGSNRYDHLNALDSCYIDHNTVIPSGEGIEIRCADLNRAAGKEAQAYIELPIDDLVIDWEPRRLRFLTGKELQVED